MPLPIYRMTKAKDVRAKPATSHNSQAGGSANGWGDLKANKGTRFSDLLEPIHAHSFHDAIISLFPAPHIRLLLICNPRPHRPLHDSLQTSDGKLKKPHFLWYESCNIMFFFFTRHSACCGWRWCGGTHLANVTCWVLDSIFENGLLACTSPG